jgi:anti-sigma factor (TIGR02949 family)
MTHPYPEAQLDAYLDGELAPDDARELEAHLGQCPECTRFLDSRLALRSAIKARIPPLRAPDTLRQRIVHTLPRRFGARVTWRWLAVAASLAVVAFASWRLGKSERPGAATGERLADVALATHIRSLMSPPGHLTDVQSSDQHTVKPWFNGRLDYSPPVYDFAGRGYPLVGGRLEYVDGRTVGALVYARRQHVINVLLWPSGRDPSNGSGTETRQGYHVLHWATPDYAYWLVSDLGLAELQEFQRLLRQADSAATFGLH